MSSYEYLKQHQLEYRRILTAGSHEAKTQVAKILLF